MTSSFSWSDNLKIAFKSCCSCIWPLQDSDSLLDPDDRINTRFSGARSGELQSLLVNHDSDTEADRISLQSNPHRGSQRKKKKLRRRSKLSSSNFTLFGYHLFGRPPIHLADDDSEDAQRHHHTSHSTVSSTFDSDAASLDVETIAVALSSSPAKTVDAPGQTSDIEAQELKKREERRRKREEKKRLKRLTEQGVLVDGEEFEGFQGTGTLSSTSTAYPTRTKPHSDHLDFGDTADFDGLHYTGNATSNRPNGGSDSRSRTSTSLSDQLTASSELGSSKSRPKSNFKGSTKSSSSSSGTSLHSPSPRQIVSPSTIEQGQGFFDLEDDGLHAKGSETYLPITSFAGTSVPRRMPTNLGHIFAQRSNDTY